MCEAIASAETRQHGINNSAMKALLEPQLPNGHLTNKADCQNHHKTKNATVTVPNTRPMSSNSGKPRPEKNVLWPVRVYISVRMPRRGSGGLSVMEGRTNCLRCALLLRLLSAVEGEQ